MPNNFAKTKPGAPLAIPAAVYNEMLDALAFIRGLRGGGPKAGTAAGGRPPLKWKNTSGQDAPDGAIFRITGIQPTTNALAYTGTKPNGTMQPFYGIALGPLKNGAIGPCVIDEPARAHFDDTDTPAFGQTWGPAPDEWHLRKNHPGFYVLGHPDGEEDQARVAVCQTMFPDFIGKTAESLDFGDDGEIEIFGASATAGTEAIVTGLTLIARDWLLSTGAIAPGKKVFGRWINGKPYIVGTECE